jgi:hypothetical protein
MGETVRKETAGDCLLLERKYEYEQFRNRRPQCAFADLADFGEIFYEPPEN